MPRAHNKDADALTPFDSNIDVPNEVIDVRIVKEDFTSHYSRLDPY